MQFADNVFLLTEDLWKLQGLLDHITDGVGMSGMLIASPKCAMLLQDWIGSMSILVFGGDNWVRWRGLISRDEESSHIQKTLLAFASLKHLWSQLDILQFCKWLICTSSLRLILLCGSET